MLCVTYAHITLEIREKNRHRYLLKNVDDPLFQRSRSILTWDIQERAKPPRTLDRQLSWTSPFKISKIKTMKSTSFSANSPLASISSRSADQLRSGRLPTSGLHVRRQKTRDLLIPKVSVAVVVVFCDRTGFFTVKLFYAMINFDRLLRIPCDIFAQLVPIHGAFSVYGQRPVDENNRRFLLSKHWVFVNWRNLTKMRCTQVLKDPNRKYTLKSLASMLFTSWECSLLQLDDETQNRVLTSIESLSRDSHAPLS